MTSPVATSRPDVDDLTPELLARLRATLTTELEAQRTHAAELQATAASLVGQQDNESLLERELAERGAEKCAEAIAAIEDALARMDAGTYGRCEACGQPIAPARLEAIPHARRCVNCPQGATRLLG